MTKKKKIISETEKQVLRTDLCLEYVLVLMQMFAGGQRPEEPREALDVAGVL